MGVGTVRELRQRAEQLRSEEALVGFFGSSKHWSDAAYMPLRCLRCVAVTRSAGTRRYKSGKTKAPPVMMAAVPAIWSDGLVHIGGPDWYEIRRPGTAPRFVQAKEGSARPVGALKNIFGRDPKRSTTFRFNAPDAPLNCQMLHWGLQMFSEEVQAQARTGFALLSDDCIEPPVFLAPIMPRRYLRLRHGASLDNQVLDCAIRGAWSIVEPARAVGELRASTRGIVRGLGGNRILFKSLEEADGGFQDEMDAEVAARGLENYIREVFGTDVGVQLTPIVGENQELQVCERQAVFLPVPKRDDWVLEELRDFPHYQALRYMAALTTTRVINGTLMLDASLAYGADEPWVDLSVLPSRVQRLKNRFLGRRGQRVEGERYHTLQYDSDGLCIDLLNLTIRTASFEEFQQSMKAKSKVKETVADAQTAK